MYSIALSSKKPCGWPMMHIGKRSHNISIDSHELCWPSPFVPKLSLGKQFNMRNTLTLIMVQRYQNPLYGCPTKLGQIVHGGDIIANSRGAEWHIAPTSIGIITLCLLGCIPHMGNRRLWWKILRHSMRTVYFKGHHMRCSPCAGKCLMAHQFHGSICMFHVFATIWKVYAWFYGDMPYR